MRVSQFNSVGFFTPVGVLVGMSMLASLSFSSAAAADFHGSKSSTSLAGLAATIVPSVTGDLARARPGVDMRVVGQSLGEPSSLRLYKLPKGPLIGSAKPSFVGLK